MKIMNAYTFEELLKPEDKKKLQEVVDAVKKKEKLKKKRQQQSIPKHKRRFMNLD